MMKQLGKVVAGGTLFTGTTLWIWSNNREHQKVFYSPEEFEKFTRDRLVSFDIQEEQPEWLGYLKYNWFSDIPLVIETSSQRHRKETRYDLALSEGFLINEFTIKSKDGPLLIDTQKRTIYKIMTRCSKEELERIGYASENGIVKSSREYHSMESFHEFMQVYQNATPEMQSTTDVSAWYPKITENIRTRCSGDRHVKIKMLYRERLTPRYLLRLCGFE